MSIEIKKQTRELTELETYLMTISPAIETLKDVMDNEVLEVSAYIEFTEEKEGKETELCCILTPDNRAIAFQSKTAKDSIVNIINIMKDKPFAVKKISGKTKAGRNFCNLVLDVSRI